MAKEYCVCILFNKSLDKTLLIHKAEGKLYGGKYNGLGGKLELGETPEQACIREIWEESDEMIKLVNPNYIAALYFPYEKPINLHVFYDVIDELNIPENREGELVWKPNEFLLDLNNDAVVGNGNMAYFGKLALLNIAGAKTAGKEAEATIK